KNGGAGGRKMSLSTRTQLTNLIAVCDVLTPIPLTLPANASLCEAIVQADDCGIGNAGMPYLRGLRISSRLMQTNRERRWKARTFLSVENEICSRSKANVSASDVLRSRGAHAKAVERPN